MHNRADLLKHCLDSVAQQQWRPMQVVIVDDGSTDASQAVAIEWGQQVSAPDFEVKIISRKQQGASAARRAGALQANGSVFAFVDSDDTLRREYSEAVMAALRMPTRSWFTGGSWGISTPAALARSSFRAMSAWQSRYARRSQHAVLRRQPQPLFPVGRMG